MTEKIAFCGLNCSSCNAFIAFKTNDEKLREITAKKWSEDFGHNNPPLRPDDINCTGCLSRKEPLFMHCNVCEVRRCGLKKKIKNCRDCENYKCDMLRKLQKIIK